MGRLTGATLGGTVKGIPVPPRTECDYVTVLGARFEQGAADLLAGHSPMCGGDGAATVYRIREGRVISTGGYCAECGTSSEAAARLLGEYGKSLPGATFVPVEGTPSWAFEPIGRRVPGTRSCGEIPFRANSDDLASRITATGVSCARARGVVRGFHANHTVTEPGKPAVGDFICAITQTDDPMLSWSVACTHDDGRTVTWIK